ncbi:MAG: class I SAM-dependent RNA methyltransferase [Planktomarina sp.]
MTFEILRLGLGGDGIAEGPLYAARTLPGEVITGDVEGDRIQNPRIQTPSAARIKSLCPAYNRCGGCALHHASDAFVSDWKSAAVLNALAARGITATVRHMHTSPENSRRRAKLTGKRTKKGAVVGFHAPRSDVLQNIDGCKTLCPEIIEMIPKLADFTTQFASRRGSLEFWILSTQTGIDLAVTGFEPTAQDEINLAAWSAGAGVARLCVGDDFSLTDRKPVLTFGHAKVTPPPKGFTQATLHGEQALQNAVKEATTGAKSAIDLFCGCGTFGLAVADQMTVTGFEGDPDLITAFNDAVRYTQGIKKAEGYVRDLFRNPLLAEDLTGLDVVIIDPPRAGAEAQMVHIAQSQINRVAMVSCNPITFARDAETLTKAGFELNWLDVVDQFRWSTHIEAVAYFSR